jgi:hypothetical protein
MIEAPRPTRRPRGRALLLAIITVLVTACGAGAPTTATTPPPATATSSGPTPASRAGALPTAAVDDAALPGTSAKLHTRDASLAVVDAGDRGIPVLAAPGDQAARALTVWAGSNRIVATGRARELPDGIWVEVRTAPQQMLGWAHSDNLVRASVMEDVTEAFVRRFGGEVPAAAGMEQLGALLAENEAAFYEGATVSRARPALFDTIGDISYDVDIPGDDAIRGIRLRVIGTPEAGRQQFRLLAVERSLLCRRDATTTAGTCDLRCVYAPEQPEWEVHDEPPPGRQALDAGTPA